MFNFFKRKPTTHTVAIYNLDPEHNDYVLVAKKDVSKDVLDKLCSANTVHTSKVSYDIFKVIYHLEDNVISLHINTTWSKNNTKVSWYERDWFFPKDN